MKTKIIICFGLFIQCAFLIFWLFRTPEVSGVLKTAKDELQKGDANLPTLTVRNSDSTETTAVYDPSKSASENLVSRAIVMLSVARSGYESIVGIPPLLALLNVVLFVILFLSLGMNRSDR